MKPGGDSVLEDNDIKDMKSCMGCDYWEGNCVLDPTDKYTPKDALCFGDEEHYLNRFEEDV